MILFGTKERVTKITGLKKNLGTWSCLSLPKWLGLLVAAGKYKGSWAEPSLYNLWGKGSDFQSFRKHHST